MKLSKSAWLHITFPLLTLILTKYYFNFPNHYFNFSNFPQIENVSSETSVFCRGTNHTDRICSFTNLCYYGNKGAFVFLNGPKSVRSGLPLSRFEPALVDFSSVEDHNTMYFNYVELPLSAVKEFDYSFIEGHALALKRFHPENLMHVFHDDLIPMYSTLRELHIPNIFLVFADDWPPGPFSSLYENFVPKSPIYLHTLPKDHLYCFESLHIGLNKLSTWYQYGFKVPQGLLHKSKEDISPAIVSFRDYFLQRFVPNGFEDKNKGDISGPLPKNKEHISPAISSFRDYFLKRFVPSGFERDEEHAVLFSRRNNRKIINEREVVDAITEMSGLRTQVLSLDDNDVVHIISSLSKCRLAVGMHGSLLVLSLFLKPNSVLIELFPFGVQACDITPFRTLCSIIGVTYIPWENMYEDNSHPHPEYPPHLGGLEHLSPEERGRVVQSVVTPFLCCDNPVWLYRIYQDTVVDIESFKISLISGMNGNPDFEETKQIKSFVEALAINKNVKGHEKVKMTDETIMESFLDTELNKNVNFDDQKNNQITETHQIQGPKFKKSTNNGQNQINEKSQIQFQETNFIDNDRITPSDIENILCTLSENSLVLVWDKPWNLELTTIQNIEYEVWIQEIDTDDVKAFIVKNQRLTVSVKPSSYYAWVRCCADGLMGPFNSSPTICAKS